MNRKLLSIAALAVLAVTACVPPEPADNVEREFICEDDGALVERHVGVKRVYRSDSTWHITYVEGSNAVYNQPFGESCRVEEYVR